MTKYSPVKPVSVMILAVVLAITLVAAPALGEDGIVLSLPDLSAPAGTIATVPVSVQNAEELAGIRMEITYDPAVLEFVSVELMEISQNGIVEASETRPGTIAVFVTDSSGISRDGDLLKISFKVTGAEGSSSPLGISASRITNMDGNDVPAQVSGGTIRAGRPGQAAPLPIIVPVLAVMFVLAVWYRRE